MKPDQGDDRARRRSSLAEIRTGDELPDAPSGRRADVHFFDRRSAQSATEDAADDAVGVKVPVKNEGVHDGHHIRQETRSSAPYPGSQGFTSRASIRRRDRAGSTSRAHPVQDAQLAIGHVPGRQATRLRRRSARKAQPPVAPVSLADRSIENPVEATDCDSGRLGHHETREGGHPCARHDPVRGFAPSTPASPASQEVPIDDGANVREQLDR